MSQYINLDQVIEAVKENNGLLVWRRNTEVTFKAYFGESAYAIDGHDYGFGIFFDAKIQDPINGDIVVGSDYQNYGLAMERCEQHARAMLLLQMGVLETQ